LVDLYAAAADGTKWLLTAGYWIKDLKRKKRQNGKTSSETLFVKNFLASYRGEFEQTV
jgi:hypothetical protein